MSANQSCVNINNFLYKNYNDWTVYLSFKITVIFLYSFTFLAGLTGNFCVIVSVVRNKHLQSVRNLFIVSLSCSDIAVCFISGTITPTSGLVKNWHFGTFLCYALPLFQAMSICISAFTLTCIAIDRYILIIYPTNRPIQRNHAICMIFAIWVLATGIATPLSTHQKLGTTQWDFPLKNNTTYTVLFCGVFCSEDWSENLRAKKIYGTAVLTFQFLIPLTIITFCYTRICIRLDQGMASRRAAENAPLTERQKFVARRKHRTNRMLIGMVCFFAFCWLPQVTLNLLRDFGRMPDFISDQENFFQILCHFVAMTTTFWNPFLYAYLNEQFRAAFIEILPCLKFYFKSTSGSTSGVTLATTVACPMGHGVRLTSDLSPVAPRKKNIKLKQEDNSAVHVTQTRQELLVKNNSEICVKAKLKSDEEPLQAEVQL